LGIAVKFGVDMDLLAQENGITSPESLQIEQELIIPFTAEELAAYNQGLQGNAPSAGSAPASQANQAGTGQTGVASDEVVPGATRAAPEAEAAPEAAAPQPTRTEAVAAPASEPAPISGRVVYPAYNPGINSYDIWMVDLATGEQTPIAGNASQPAFNRDGTLLAYRSWERSTRGIFFRDFVGGRGGIVTRFVEDGLPSWSPDGYSFSFASRKEGDRVPRIYIGNQLGEETFAVGFQGEYPDTFPDGRLVIKGCTPSGDCGLFIIGPRGGGEKKISGEGGDTAPAVSPDGTKIAFMSSGRGATNWEIWVMNADGSNTRRLTENRNNDGLPAWSPDGKSIAYVSDQGGVWAVWVMNADGSNQRKLFDMKGPPDGKVLHDEFNSRGWLEERISWAP
jgi:TolB protein